MKNNNTGLYLVLFQIMDQHSSEVLILLCLDQKLNSNHVIIILTKNTYGHADLPAGATPLPGNSMSRVSLLITMGTGGYKRRLSLMH